MDGVASLRPCPVDVELGGWIYTIPALPAADWIEAVLSGAIFPGLLRDRATERDVLQLLANDGATTDELVEANRAALEVAAGYPWWTADRLVRSAMHEKVRPVLLGSLFGDGLALRSLSLGAFCDAVYARAVAGLDDEKRGELDAELNLPPAEAADEVWDDEAAEADFLAAHGPVDLTQIEGPADPQNSG